MIANRYSVNEMLSLQLLCKRMICISVLVGFGASSTKPTWAKEGGVAGLVTIWLPFMFSVSTRGKCFLTFCAL